MADHKRLPASLSAASTTANSSAAEADPLRHRPAASLSPPPRYYPSLSVCSFSFSPPLPFQFCPPSSRSVSPRFAGACLPSASLSRRDSVRSCPGHPAAASPASITCKAHRSSQATRRLREPPMCGPKSSSSAEERGTGTRKRPGVKKLELRLPTKKGLAESPTLTARPHLHLPHNPTACL